MHSQEKPIHLLHLHIVKQPSSSLIEYVFHASYLLYVIHSKHIPFQTLDLVAPFSHSENLLDRLYVVVAAVVARPLIVHFQYSPSSTSKDMQLSLH